MFPFRQINKLYIRYNAIKYASSIIVRLTNTSITTDWVLDVVNLCSDKIFTITLLQTCYHIIWPNLSYKYGYVPDLIFSWRSKNDNLLPPGLRGLLYHLWYTLITARCCQYNKASPYGHPTITDILVLRTVFERTDTSSTFNWQLIFFFVLFSPKLQVHNWLLKIVFKFLRMCNSFSYWHVFIIFHQSNTPNRLKRGQ